MIDSIRKYKNNDELIKELENRNLIFSDKESKEIFKLYLLQYGYFSFVKKMSNSLMYEDTNKKIFKSEFTSNNLRYLFDIDRNISIVLFKYFRNIEYLFNASLLKVLARKLNKLVKCPYIAALDSEGVSDIFSNIHNEMPDFKKWDQNTYLNLYDDLFKNMNNVDFNIYDVVKKNKEQESSDVLKIIDQGWFGNFIVENKKRTNKKIFIDWKYVDLFSLFQVISFSQLIRIFKYLSSSLKNEVIKEFFNEYKPSNKYSKLKEDSFLSLIYSFSNLRNILMHNGVMIKYKTKINEVQKEQLENYFNIKIENNEIRLNEIILMMELIINVDKKIENEIYESINTKFTNRTKRSDNISKLLFEIIKGESRIELEN